VTLEIKIDESEPEDSVKRYASEITSTGEEVVAVPPHWHKVIDSSGELDSLQAVSARWLFNTNMPLKVSFRADRRSRRPLDDDL
jgi:hypothetical protein